MDSVGKANKEKDLRFELIRCIAMLFVLAVHNKPNLFVEDSFLGELEESTFRACNGLFFMLSGRFALSSDFDSLREIKSFYWKRFSALLPPFIIFGTLNTLMDLIRGEESWNFAVFVKASLKGLMGEWSGTHLWFMFTMIGFILIAPIIGKALQSFKDEVLTFFMIMIFIWIALIVFLDKDFGYKFAYSNIFYGWLFFFVLGYYENRVLQKSKHRKVFAICGLIALVANVILIKLPDTWYISGGHDLSPIYICYVFGLYIFLKDLNIAKASGVVKKAVLFLSAQSYVIYLSHRIPHKLLADFNISSNRVISSITNFILMFTGTLVISVLFNLGFKKVKSFLLAKNPYRQDAAIKE